MLISNYSVGCRRKEHSSIESNWRVSIEYRLSQGLIIRDIYCTGRVTWKINVYLKFSFDSFPNITNTCFIDLNAAARKWNQTPDVDVVARNARDFCNSWRFQDLTSATKLAELLVWQTVTWLLFHCLFCSEVICGLPSIEGEKTLSSQVGLFSSSFLKSCSFFSLLVFPVSDEGSVY